MQRFLIYTAVIFMLSVTVSCADFQADMQRALQGSQGGQTQVADSAVKTLPPNTNCAQDLAGTEWYAAYSGGTECRYRFRPFGLFHWNCRDRQSNYEENFATNGTWKREGNQIYIRMDHNDRNAPSEETAILTCNTMKGDGWRGGLMTWTWSANRIASP